MISGGCANPREHDTDRPQKCTKIPPFFDAKFFTKRAQKAQKHYVLNGLAEFLVSRLSGESQKEPFRRPHGDNGCTISAHPLERSKPLENKRETAPGESGRVADSPSETPFCGQDSPPTAYIYIYIYIYICRVKNWSKLCLFIS